MTNVRGIQPGRNTHPPPTPEPPRQKTITEIGDERKRQREAAGTERAPDISGVTDVVNFILLEVECPGTHRAYVDAVIGKADNCTDWFDAADYEIGKRIVGDHDDRSLTKGAITKRAQRERDRFDEWQVSAGLRLIESMPGGMINKRKVCTRYGAEILAVAREVYGRVYRDGAPANPRKAVRDELRRERGGVRLIDRLRSGGAPVRHERRGLNRGGFDKPDRYLNTALTNLETYVQMTEAQGGYPDPVAVELLHRLRPAAAATDDSSIHRPSMHRAVTVDRSVQCLGEEKSTGQAPADIFEPAPAERRGAHSGVLASAAAGIPGGTPDRRHHAK